jgi:hypothetical protein
VQTDGTNPNNKPDILIRDDYKETCMLIIINITIIIFSGTAAQRGLLPPRSRGFLITKNDTPQSIGFL